MRRAATLALAAALLGAPGCRGRERPATRGLAEGYFLLAPLLSRTTFLVDRAGRVVHAWESPWAPGLAVHLLPNGHLLRAARRSDVPAFSAAGFGGRLEERDWDGALVWEWVVEGDDLMPHHDVAPLPNGNVLLIAWERKSRTEAIRAGRDPAWVDAGGLWPDALLELRPERPRGGRVVWEWHAWDHLVQERDGRLANFGRVADHPGRIDLNAVRPEGIADETLARLRAIGYLAGAGGRSEALADFMHTNSVDYDAASGRILLSVSKYGEVWFLDHGTTSREAAGRGGELLGRWGNPRAHGRGTERDRRLFGQHDARWVGGGPLRPAPSFTVFDNGAGRPGRDRSAVLEVEVPRGLPLARLETAAPRGTLVPRGEPLFAEFLSGAQRMPDGNTLVTDGPEGRLLELTPGGEVVWRFESPFSGDAPNPQGDPPRALFRATFVPAGHPALAGRNLTPRAWLRERSAPGGRGAPRPPTGAPGP